MISNDKYSRFNDFAEEETQFEGEKKKIETILNIEILIIGFRIGKSKFNDKNYLTLQYENDGNRYICFTGSEVLMKQTQKYADKIPFYVTIKKVNKYYTMT